MPVTRAPRLLAAGIAAALALAGCSGRRDTDAGDLDGILLDVQPADVPTADAPALDAPDGGTDAADAGGLDAVGGDGDAAKGPDASDAIADGGELDAPADAADAGGDAGPSGDAVTDVDLETAPDFDAAVLDADSGSFCAMDAGAGRVCTMDSECAAPTEQCLETGCGSVRRCMPVGRPCRDGSDCLAGAQMCTRGRCVATGSDCGDTRACPLGFLCEGAVGSRRCVDRRRPCAGAVDPCPHNAGCFGVPGVAGFCVAIATRCATDDACLLGTRCRDLDGDGLRECVPDGPCDPRTCPASAPTCEFASVEFVSICGQRGFCSSARPCPSGYDCVDPWGTGVRECRPSTDPCRSHAECAAPRSLCYTREPDRDAIAPGCQ